MSWGLDPWLEKIPWRKWQPTPVFLLRKSHGQRRLPGHSSWHHKRVGHDWVTKQQQQNQPFTKNYNKVVLDLAYVELQIVCILVYLSLRHWKKHWILALLTYWHLTEEKTPAIFLSQHNPITKDRDVDSAFMVSKYMKRNMQELCTFSWKRVSILRLGY